MNKTIEEAATKYAANQMQRVCEFDGLSDVGQAAFDGYELAVAFEHGARFALSHQWCSVEEELPQIPEGKKMIRVFAMAGEESLVCWYTCHGRFITTFAAKEKYFYDSVKEVKVHLSPDREDVTEIVTHFMPIPSLNLKDQ